MEMSHIIILPTIVVNSSQLTKENERNEIR